MNRSPLSPTSRPRRRALTLAVACVALVLSTTASTRVAASSATPTFPVGTHAASEPSGLAPPGPTALAGYSLVYSQDFTGATLPAEWDAYSGQPGGDPGALFASSHVSVANGMLQIVTYQDPVSGQWVTGGTCLCGHPGLLYGAVFVRSRVTAPGDDDVELLWPDANVWPPEIDFNETGGPTTSTTATIHWGPQNSQSQVALSIDMTKWHTWGVIWTPISVRYVVDGRLWGVVTNPHEIPDIAMHLSIQSQTFCSAHWACPVNGTTNSELVDWVAEYAPNAVAATTTTAPTPANTTTTTPASNPTPPSVRVSRRGGVVSVSWSSARPTTAVTVRLYATANCGDTVAVVTRHVTRTSRGVVRLMAPAAHAARVWVAEAPARPSVCTRVV